MRGRLQVEDAIKENDEKVSFFSSKWLSPGVAKQQPFEPSENSKLYGKSENDFMQPFFCREP